MGIPGGSLNSSVSIGVPFAVNCITRGRGSPQDLLPLLTHPSHQDPSYPISRTVTALLCYTVRYSASASASPRRHANMLDQLFCFLRPLVLRPLLYLPFSRGLLACMFTATPYIMGPNTCTPSTIVDKAGVRYQTTKTQILDPRLARSTSHLTKNSGGWVSGIVTPGDRVVQRP